jgi:transcriptional antiterminator NusG
MDNTVQTEPIASAEANTKWYVLRVISGKEKKVKEYLDKEIARSGWSEAVKQVFLPVEKVYKVASGKKVVRERNYYPGYVMIEITSGKLSDDLRDLIKNTTNVIHFLGKDDPIALRKAEVNKMLGKMDELLDEMRQTRVTTAVAQERMNNHIQNMFVHLNKWYASAVIIGGILAAVLLKVGGH